MKVTSSTVLATTAATILSGIMASDFSKANSDEACIRKAIEMAQKLLDAVPDFDTMPSDEDIKTACKKLIPKGGEIGAALLGEGLGTTFNVHRGLAYTIAQKAVQLGVIKPKTVGKNKTAYTLA